MCKFVGLLGAVAVVLAFGAAPAAAQHAAVGAEKCGKVCHKVEFDSWSKSKHATAAKKTDCEACHGNGADYIKLSVMKDPAQAKAAGLIAKPALSSCATCHKAGEVTAASLASVHDRKKK
ncbi:MAG: cytochrome c3 family protein [Vicinamibacterales bacterium]